jgi:hypothetical protein
MSWVEIVERLRAIRDRLAGTDHLEPEVAAKLAREAQELVVAARGVLRRAEDDVAHLHRLGQR